VQGRSLLDILVELSPSAREELRGVLLLDHPDRVEIATELLAFRDPNTERWGDLIDILTENPDIRGNVVRLIDEFDID
jgi:hypothetical protein